jgi:TIR domain
MAKVFISYRRADGATVSGRIYDHLKIRFGKRNIFKDVDDIPMGMDFGEYIKDSLRESAVLLVVIGQHWLTDTTTGIRKLDDPEDWVRIEIETAFQLGLTVIPLLVDGTKMPTADGLPQSLRVLPKLNYLSLREDPDFTRDMERVITSCELALASRLISNDLPQSKLLRYIFARILHLRGQLNTSQGRRVAPVIVSLMTIVALLGVLVVRAEVGSSPPTAPTQGPVFPLHVAAPGVECDHGWSSSYWSNRFGTANCLTTYTRITTQNATCSDPACTSVGTLEFALAAAHLKLPKRYTISVVATLMVAGQKPVAGSRIGLVLQDFFPATPYGLEYVILLNADGSYFVAKYDCPSPQPVCTETDRLGGGSVDVTASHTFGYRYDGKTTFAKVDGVEIDMKSAVPPSSFKFVQLLVGSSDSHTTVSANFGDFSIQPD